MARRTEEKHKNTNKENITNRANRANSPNNLYAMKKESQGTPSNEEYTALRRLINEAPTAEPNLFGWAEPMETEYINSELAIVLRLARLKRSQTVPGVLSISTSAAGTLWETMQEFYKRYEPQVKRALQGARPDTVEAVLMDFGGILNGHHFFVATAEQMRDALANCSKLRAYGVEKYAFFIGVMGGYERYLTIWDDCQNIYINNSDTAQKSYFLRLMQVTRGNLPALAWQNIIYREEDLFNQASAEVPAETVDAFRKWAQTFGNEAYLSLYITICREVLNATAQQLREIFDANGLTLNNGEYMAADLFGDEARVYLDRIAEQVAAVAKAETNAQRKESAEELQAVINRPLAVVGSRSIYGNVTGTESIFTITAIIRDYLQQHPDSRTTADYVEKALEGVGIILAAGTATERKGQTGTEYLISVTTSRFAELCGLKDANEQQLIQLYSAVGVLDGLFLCVWQPRGYDLQRLLTVERFEFRSGGKIPDTLKMTFYTSAFTDRKKIIILSPEVSRKLQEMKASKRGAAWRHFGNQILTKGHKREETLLDEVFSYTARLDDARANTTNEAEVSKVEDDIRKHKSRDRRKLAQFFEDYQRKGLITYTYCNGVYSWKSLDASTKDEPGTADGQKENLAKP